MLTLTFLLRGLEPVPGWHRVISGTTPQVLKIRERYERWGRGTRPRGFTFPKIPDADESSHDPLLFLKG